MCIKYLLFLFCSLFIGTVFSQNKDQSTSKNKLILAQPHKRDFKYSLFERPIYKKTQNNSFKYESPNEKYGLYLTGMISGRADSFFNTQGIIMNMGTNAIDLKNQNNVTRTWVYTASPIMEAKLDDDIHIRFNPDFGQDQLRIFDAYVDINYFRTFSIMAGFQHALISNFEPLAFNYPGFTNNMSPWKEIALKLYGQIGPSLYTSYSYQRNRALDSWFFYELAITNGAPDAAFPGLIPFSVNSTGYLYQLYTFNVGNKAFEGRFFFNPFIQEENHPLQHFGIGFAGGAMTACNQIGLPAFLSLGRNVIFQFNSLENYSIAQGRRNRIHPQFNWSYKNFAIIGDYIISSQQLSNTSYANRTKQRPQNRR